MTDDAARSLASHLQAFYADMGLAPTITIDPKPARDRQSGPTIRIGPPAGRHVAITEGLARTSNGRRFIRIFIVTSDETEFLCGPDPIQAASCAIYNYTLMNYSNWLLKVQPPIAVDEPREWDVDKLTPGRPLPADLRGLAAESPRPGPPPSATVRARGKGRRDN